MSDDESGDVRAQLRDALSGMLIDKVRADRFPSATMMNMVEDSLEQRRLAEYAQVLMEKVEDSQYPSIDMIRRLAGLL